jgi:RND family efflux transporter MFP subunit
MKLNTIKYLSLFLLTLGFVACSEEKKSLTEIDQKPITVSVKKIKKVNITDNIVFTGRIEAAKKAKLSTRLMGTIEKITVKVGDKVRKGQLVFTISKKGLLARRSQLYAQKKQAQTILNNLNKDKQRTETLFSKKSATQKQLDDVTTAYYAAEANLSILDAGISEVNSNINYATVTAPFDGLVSAKLADVGSLSAPGVPVVSMVSTNYKAIVTVSENQIHNIKKGETVSLVIPSLGETVEAKITQIAPSGSFNAGQFAVTVVPTKVNNKFKDGLYAQVELHNRSESVILLGDTEIVTRGQLQGVYIVGSNGEAVLNWIRLGKHIEDKWLVLSGVKEGDQVICKSDGQLKDGQKITISK